MSLPLRCTITTPEMKVYDGPARSVVVPAADGELGIFPRHAPLVGGLGSGELRIAQPDGAQLRLFIEGGFVQVFENVVTVLAAAAIHAGELDLTVEEDALRRLRESPPSRGVDTEALDDYARRVEAQRVRLRVARKWLQE